MLVAATGLLLECHESSACFQIRLKMVSANRLKYFVLSNRRYDNGVSGGVSGMNAFLEKFYPSASLLILCMNTRDR